jgi:tripartite-type tricarboxylate transporter receptor subunit TctC
LGLKAMPRPHRLGGHDTARRKLVAAGAGALLGAATVARGAGPAAFPSGPVRLVVPYSVGIGPDVVARSVAAQLQAEWRQPVVVENKPGAAGIVAFATLRRTPPDGHTLFLADSATLAIHPLLQASLPYDPQADIEPLSLLFQATFMLFTAARPRHASLAALLQAARGRDDAVSYAALGHGHPSHLAVELMGHAAGVRMLAVHYKDAGTLMTGVAAGDVDFTAISMNTMAPLFAAGRVRPLAVGAAWRLAAFPDVPTLAQAGGPAMTMHPWAGLVTVAGTPAPRLAQLQRGIASALASAEVQRMADQAGFEITPSAAGALRERAAADRALIAPLVREGRVARMG